MKTSKKLIAAVLVIVALVFLSPFVHFAIFGNFPPGFPIGEKKNTTDRQTIDESIVPNAPIAGPEGGLDVFRSLIFFELDNLQSVHEAKKLGANGITITVDLGVQGKSFEFPSEWRGKKFELEKVIGPFIEEAHKLGLYVELRTTQSPWSAPTEEFDQKELIKSYALRIEELSRIAEKYHVYHLTTAGEIDTLVHRAYKNPPKRMIAGEEINPFAQASLKAAKGIYTGKIGIGLSAPSRYISSQEFETLNLAGYDYFEFTLYPKPQDKNLTFFSRDAIENTNAAITISKKSNIQEIIWGETGILNNDENMPGSFGGNSAWLSGTKQFESEFYNLFFTLTNGNVDGYTIFYEFPVFSIKGQETEATIKYWFSKSKPRNPNK